MSKENMAHKVYNAHLKKWHLGDYLPDRIEKKLDSNNLKEVEGNETQVSEQ